MRCQRVCLTPNLSGGWTFILPLYLLKFSAPSVTWSETGQCSSTMPVQRLHVASLSVCLHVCISISVCHLFLFSLLKLLYVSRFSASALYSINYHKFSKTCAMILDRLRKKLFTNNPSNYIYKKSLKIIIVLWV